MRYIVLLLLAGCGRIAFDERADAATADAGPICGAPIQPASITFAGTTFRYTSFTNDRALVDTVSIEARDAGTTTLAKTISDAAGAYKMMDVPAVAHPSLHYGRTGYETTRVFFDLPFAGDVQGSYQALWTAGDGPLWTSTAMNNVYDTAQPAYQRITGEGTVNVAIRDCAGTPLAGVRVDLDPPADLMAYLAADGTPDTGLSETVEPFAHAMALNVPTGHVHITASAPGLRFTDVDVMVEGQSSTMAVIHGSP